MSYAAAAQPAPAPNSTAGYVFFKAMFDHVFAVYNAYETANNAAVATHTTNIATNTTNIAALTTALGAPDANPTPNAIFKRNADAAGTLGSLAIGGVATISNTVAQLYMKAVVAQSLDILTLRQADNRVALRVDPYGNMVVGDATGVVSNISVNGGVAATVMSTTTGFIGPLTGDVTGNATGLKNIAAGGIPVGVGTGAATILAAGTSGYALISNGPGVAPSWQPSSQFSVALANIADGAVAAQTVPNMTVNAKPYSYYSTTKVYGTVSGTSPAYPALPTPGNQRFDLLYADDAFALQWKLGTPAASSPTKPTPDDNTRPLAWVGPVTSATTQLTGGMIFEARPSPTSGGGTGAAGGGIDLTAKPFFTYHTDGTLTQEMDWFTWADGTTNTAPDATDLSAKRIDPSRVKRASGASLDYMQQRFIEPTLLAAQSLSKSAANTVTLAASAQSPVTIRDKTLAASVSATASGSAGARYVIFDTAANSGAGGLVSPMPTTQVLTATEVLLAVYWWDGSTLQDGLFMDASPLGTLPSTSLTRTQLIANDNGATTGALATTVGPAFVPNFPFTTFYTPVQCRMVFDSWSGYTYTPAGTSPGLKLTVQLDGQTIGRGLTTSVGGTYAMRGPFSTRDVLVAPGSHSLGLYYENVAGTGSTVNFFGTFQEIAMTFYKG